MVSSLLVVALTTTVVLLCTQKKDALTAEIYLRNDIIEVVNLEKETEPREFEIEGEKDKMMIEVKHNAIRVKESSCPHKDCVNTGWISSTNRPIICAYNAIYIKVVNGTSDVDIEV